MKQCSTMANMVMWLLFSSMVGMTGWMASHARPLPVRVDRWLAVQQVSGNVFFQSAQFSGPARVGLRLQAVGDGLKTGKGASTTLDVDTGIGSIQVAENTTIRIRSLEIAPDNGRITRLQVTGGQVRFQIRRFTHQGSQLEIQTPAGLTGVRGTDFGLGVQPNGKTGVATLSGAVMTTAQGRSVLLRAGYQNFTIPGEGPSPAVPLRNDTSLKAEFIREFAGNARQIRLVGQVDPVNTVIVDGKPISTDRNGQFSVMLPAIFRLQIQVQVITPLGKEQIHELTFS